MGTRGPPSWCLPSMYAPRRDTAAVPPPLPPLLSPSPCSPCLSCYYSGSAKRPPCHGLLFSLSDITYFNNLARAFLGTSAPRTWNPGLGHAHLPLPLPHLPAVPDTPATYGSPHVFLILSGYDPGCCLLWLRPHPTVRPMLASRTAQPLVEPSQRSSRTQLRTLSFNLAARSGGPPPGVPLQFHYKVPPRAAANCRPKSSANRRPPLAVDRYSV